MAQDFGVLWLGVVVRMVGAVREPFLLGSRFRTLLRNVRHSGVIRIPEGRQWGYVSDFGSELSH